MASSSIGNDGDNSTHYVQIEAVDNNAVEGNKVLCLELVDAAYGANLDPGKSLVQFTVEDDDETEEVSSLGLVALITLIGFVGMGALVFYAWRRLGDSILHLLSQLVKRGFAGAAVTVLMELVDVCSDVVACYNVVYDKSLPHHIWYVLVATVGGCVGFAAVVVQLKITLEAFGCCSMREGGNGVLTRDVTRSSLVHRR